MVPVAKTCAPLAHVYIAILDVTISLGFNKFVATDADKISVVAG
jgi:hypothetical protein